jgi:hypothetical protein
MPADGFTKRLFKQRHIEFTRQLKLEDITGRISLLLNSQTPELPSNLAG